MQTENDPFSSGSSASAVAEVVTRLNPALADCMTADRPSLQPSTTPPPKKGLKKLSFGGIAVKKEETKTAYPVYDQPEAALIAARIKQRQADIEALGGRADPVDKAELKQSVGLFYFQTNHGRHEIPQQHQRALPRPRRSAGLFPEPLPGAGKRGPHPRRARRQTSRPATLRRRTSSPLTAKLPPGNAPRRSCGWLQQLVAKYSAAEALTSNT